MVGIKEVAIGTAAVSPGCCKRGTAQHQLIDHELSVVLAECALDGAVAGIGGVGAAGPLPNQPESVVEMAGPGSYFPFHFGRQMLAAPARERVGLVIADMADRAGGIDRLQSAQRHDVPFAGYLAPMAGRLPLFVAGGRETIHQPQRWRRVAAI